MHIVRSRRSREESSPDRAKVCMQMQHQQPNLKPFKKVQVVYYLSRNGHLEHPHYMEVTHLSNHRLRLRDVMDRLTVLRGKGMPSLYSWSCKRSYKNGYVWNDLGDNDVIYPSDGAEYVLKGSQLVEGCSERFQQVEVANNRQIIKEASLHAKGKQVSLSQRKQMDETQTGKFDFEEYVEEEEEEEEEESQEEYEDEEKTSSYTSSTTPHSRCSRGVSTDELEDQQPPNKNPTTDPTSHSDHNTNTNANANTTSKSKRYEDGDPVVPRNSVLLQLISCGNLAAARPKNSSGCGSILKQEGPKGKGVVKKSDVQKGGLYKSAIKVGEEDVIIRYMCENPRFGNLQAEEKEYFSGSIVESMRENRVIEDPIGLKRSNSYNEERSRKEGMEEGGEKAGGRGKCIPRKVLSSSSSKERN